MKTKKIFLISNFLIIFSIGNCQCPQGYTGILCLTQVTPQFILVTKITVTKFVDGGEDAFPSSRPDIFVKLVSSTDNLYKSDWVQDADPSGNYSFTPDTPIKLSPFEKTYWIITPNCELRT